MVSSRTRSGGPEAPGATVVIDDTDKAIIEALQADGRMPYTRLGADFGFVPPPAAFYPLLGGMLLSYLLVVEGIKRWFYRRMASTTPITSAQN